MSADGGVPAAGEKVLGGGAFLKEDASEAVDDMQMDHGMEGLRTGMGETAGDLGGHLAVLVDDRKHLFPGLAIGSPKDGGGQDRI